MSYTKDLEKSDSLPDIKRAGSGDSLTRRTSEGETKLPTDDRSHLLPKRHERGSTPSLFRPHSAEQNKKFLFEMQQELKAYKDELKRKDDLIQQMVQYEPSKNGSAMLFTQRSYDTDKVESLLTAGIAAESARGEVAALNVKVENLQKQLGETKHSLELREGRCREFSNEISAHEEAAARNGEIIRGLRERLGELEAHSGQFETVAGRTELALRTLREENAQLRERIKELETSISNQLRTKESVEARLGQTSKSHSDLLSHISCLLNLEGPESSDVVLRQLNEMVREYAVLKGKLNTMSSTMHSTELEMKANRETINRLAAEISREQKSTAKSMMDTENIKMERDAAKLAKEKADLEIENLEKRLDACQRAYANAKQETDTHINETSTLRREAQDNIQAARSSKQQLDLVFDRLKTVLREAVPADTELRSLQDLEKHLKLILVTSRDRKAHVEMLDAKIVKMTEQFEEQYRLRESAEGRQFAAENSCREIASRLEALEGDLAENHFLRDGLRVDKEKYLKFMENLAGTMKMDRITHDVGFDMNADAIMLRAEQLVKLEKDTLNDRSTKIYNLQRRIKQMKEQMESKDLHLDLLRKKISQLEEKLVGRGEVERDRDNELARSKKFEKRLEKYKLELADARIEIKELKARLLSSTDLKVQTLEMQKEIETMAHELAELERIKDDQRAKITHLRKMKEEDQRQTGQKQAVTSSTIEALTSELKTTKNALEEASKRERQLLDLRQVVARMLGLNVHTLAVPDFELVRRLESLIQSHQSYNLSNNYLQDCLADVDDAYRVGYDDATRVFSPGREAAQRSGRSPVRVSSPKYGRSRSVSPRRVLPTTVDPVAY